MAAFVGLGNRGESESQTIEGCERAVPSDWSVARIWNEALLGAIRLDVPAPTVHARTLFHTSAAMWDAWAAYDDTATGVFVDEDQVDEDLDAAGVLAAREEAISFAVYRHPGRALSVVRRRRGVGHGIRSADGRSVFRPFLHRRRGRRSGCARQSHRQHDPERNRRRRFERGEWLRRRHVCTRQPLRWSLLSREPSWTTPTGGSHWNSK